MDNFKIKVIIDNKEVSATICNTPTSKDFISMFPLTLNVKDYANTEKVSDLPKKLSVKDAQNGSDPSIGDITYYAPWGNLALFYKDFGYADGLIILGKIDNIEENIEFLKKAKVIKFMSTR